MHADWWRAAMPHRFCRLALDHDSRCCDVSREQESSLLYTTPPPFLPGRIIAHDPELLVSDLGRQHKEVGTAFDVCGKRTQSTSRACASSHSHAGMELTAFTRSDVVELESW